MVISSAALGQLEDMFAIDKNKALPRLRFAEPMSQHSTFGIGGRADIFFEPVDTAEIIQAVQFCRQHGIPLTVIGKGSNILVSDQGVRGMVLAVSSRFSGVEQEEGLFLVKAGTRLAHLAGVAARLHYGGLEFAAGIPGTVGGAVQMNAGAYGSCMQDVVLETEYLDEQQNICTVNGPGHQFSYRHSMFSDRQCIILRVAYRLEQAEYSQIITKMTELTEKRRRSQPLELPSAGSTFKRPPGHFAGKLISDCKLKGLRIGDAQVSEKHAGFIVNLGQATAFEVRSLISRIQSTVLHDTGVLLEPEIKFIGDWQDYQAGQAG